MSLCNDYRRQLEGAMQDEICDAGFYAQIAQEAPSQELSELIMTIVGDEYGHARLLAALLGVCPPCAGCAPECAKTTGNFCADVETAIQGELDAIQRYSVLAMCAPTLKIRYLLLSILGDEYAHVRIWTAMLQACSLCKPTPCDKD